MRTERSYLFVPGDRPERFDKALASGAHAVILDLEDAVMPARKITARAALSEWLSSSSASVLIRINPSGTPWHMADCELLASRAVRGVMLPKAQDAGELGLLAQRLRPDQVLVPLVETVAGWFEMGALAKVQRVERLAFGSVDFMSDSGIQGELQELDAVRTQMVLVSRHTGLRAPIDGVSLALDNAAQLQADTERSRRFGFGGKLCIHPRQVKVVNSAFLPTPAQIAWAQRVVHEAQSGSLSAIAVDGKLVDKPVVLLAEALLREAEEAVAER